MIALRLVPPDDPRLVQMAAAMGMEAGLDPFEVPGGDSYFWIIEEDGSPVGFTGVHSINWVSRRCRGMLWIAPAWRRKGYGREALRQRNDILFDSYNMNRVEWATDTANAPMIAMGESLGHVREGTARQVAFYGGRYHDYALFSVIRSDRGQ